MQRATSQLRFDWTPPCAVPATLPERARALRYDDLRAYVQRVRLAGISRLRQLKGLVDEAVRVEELYITDDDIPF